MQTQEKKTIDIELDDVAVAADKRVNRRLIAGLLLLVVTLAIVGAVFGFVQMYRAQRTLATTVNEQADKIAALEQEADTRESELAALEEENDALKSKNEALVDENAAFKSEISKFGLQYPAAAYEGKKLVALTFDDGPGPYTAELLDFLKEHKVRATFFLLGTNVSNYSALVKRMDAEGHAIGNHSNNHPILTKLSAANVASQLEKCNAAIRKAAGHNAVVMRCPGGANNATVKKAAANANMPIIHWSVDTRDWELRDKDKILHKTFNEIGIEDGDIVLLHDIHRESVDATKEMILRLEKEGYTFVTVPELLSVRKGGMTAGVVYSDAPPKG